MEWPGNVRELRNTVERLLILSRGNEIGAADVERLPERRHTTLLGISVPLFVLCPFEGSAPAKLRFALQALAGDELKTQAALIAP